MPDMILLVYDEAPLRELVSEILREHSYRVLEAIDGVGAISTAQREHPAMVILDFRMPGMDGVEVCRVLKQGRTTGQSKVIILTVATDNATRQRAGAAGADAYLTKPFALKDLLETIEAVLGSEAD